MIKVSVTFISNNAISVLVKLKMAMQTSLEKNILMDFDN